MSAEFVDGETRIVHSALYVNDNYVSYTDRSPERVTLADGRPADIIPEYNGFDVEIYPDHPLSSHERASRIAARLGLIPTTTEIYRFNLYSNKPTRELKLADGTCVIPMILNQSADAVTPWFTVTRPR